MTASPAKFLFDIDFGTGVEAKPSIALAEHRAKLAEAEAAAYRNGFAAAEAEARNVAQQRNAAALERVAAMLDGIHQRLGTIEAQYETEAVEVAVAVAKKLAPALIAREPLAEIAALATDCFRHLVAAPHLVVRVNDGMHDLARRQLEELTRARGFEGRLVVLAEPGLAPGDCRIEWADGGITRNAAAAQAVIDDAVARYVAGRTSEATTQESRS
jgi:flagellar assembly protein FliH